MNKGGEREGYMLNCYTVVGLRHAISPPKSTVADPFVIVINFHLHD